jgi:LysR family transcriptional regulator, glycine cleavage system transcriptional activator
MTKEIPPLGALRAFESASRQLSFVRAADELHVTPAAVSHQIKQLEQWLKLKLFNRGANGVTLTAAGRDYAQRIHEVFDLLTETTRTARANRQRSVVVIRTQFTIATMWLMPRLVALKVARPDIDVSLIAVPDGMEAKVSPDLVIHESQVIAGYRHEPLQAGKFKAYASPAMLARCPKPTPARLLSQPLIHTVLINQRRRYPGFAEWFQAAGVEPPPVLPGLSFNLVHLTANACVLGAGFAILLDEYCLDSVRAGSLVAIPGPAIESPHPIFIHLRKDAGADAQFVQQWLLEKK